MEFHIQPFEENGIEGFRLTDLTTTAFADVLPQHGMLFHAFQVPVNGGLFNVIDNYASKEILEKQIGLSYKGCKMSPFVCRIPAGRYSFLGKSYELENKFTDGAAIHGLLSDKNFEVMETRTDSNGAIISGRYEYKNEDQGYPFHYVCEITYTLSKSFELIIHTSITNYDSHEIPVADGWHPYFTLGGKVDDCLLQFNSTQVLEFDERLVPTGNIIHYNDFSKLAMIGSRKLDNCFLLRVVEEGPCCVLKTPTNNLSLCIYTNEQYPFLQVYIPEHRNSIAIENLSGAPDCFNNRMGLHLLEPGSTKKFEVSYKIS